jgi:hypothetical protein
MKTETTNNGVTKMTDNVTKIENCGTHVRVYFGLNWLSFPFLRPYLIACGHTASSCAIDTDCHVRKARKALALNGFEV